MPYKPQILLVSATFISFPQIVHWLSYQCIFWRRLLFSRQYFLIIYRQDCYHLRVCSIYMECNIRDTNLCNQDGRSWHPLFLKHLAGTELQFYLLIRNSPGIHVCLWSLLVQFCQQLFEWLVRALVFDKFLLPLKKYG